MSTYRGIRSCFFTFAVWLTVGAISFLVLTKFLKVPSSLLAVGMISAIFVILNTGTRIDSGAVFLILPSGDRVVRFVFR